VKKIFAFVGLAVLACVAHAEGYMGASYLRSKHDIGCADNNICQTKTGGYRLLAGAKLPAAYVPDFGGVVSLDAVEVGLSKFGRVDADTLVSEIYYASASQKTRLVPARLTVSSDAIHAAWVARLAVFSGFDLNAKIGVAYVSTTGRKSLKGTSNGGSTENHLSPVLGLGAELGVWDGLKLAVGVETVRFKYEGESGNLKSVELGFRYSF
jgi:hypothetical protein